MTVSETSAAAIDSAPLSVKVNKVHVKYRVYQDIDASLEGFIRRGGRRAIDVHALKGVSFDVRVGESVGVIGLNGSGKSTLLRTIAGIQPVSAGNVLVRGEAHLLGIGAALKPLLSGHRNIVLGGLAMGMRRAEVEARINDVIDFTELHESIHRPLNTYSAGMLSRLAFAIATLRVPDVLLVDEALAVGDLAFRDRSLARLRELRTEAASVVLVTHSLNEIRETCERAIWLDHGELRADGDAEEVLGAYESSGGVR